MEQKFNKKDNYNHSCLIDRSRILSLVLLNVYHALNLIDFWYDYHWQKRKTDSGYFPTEMFSHSKCPQLS